MRTNVNNKVTPISPVIAGRDPATHGAWPRVKPVSIDNRIKPDVDEADQRLDWLRLIRSQNDGPPGIMAQTPQGGRRPAGVPAAANPESLLARLTDSAYRLAVDIGLGRFLEMFEERFGRKATTALLAIIGLGVTAFMLSLIWEHLVIPLYSLAGIVIGKPHSPIGVGFNLTWADVSQIGLTILGVILVIIFAITYGTMIMMLMRDFVFDYWKTYFRDRAIERAIKEREKAQRLNPPRSSNPDLP
jgi:hypothetical protein